MPSSGSGRSTNREEGANAFVQVGWNTDLDERFLGWWKPIGLDLVDELTTRTTLAGLKVSLGAANDGFVAVIRDPRREMERKPSALSGWAGTSMEALGVALFKHWELCPGQDWDKFQPLVKSARR